MSKTLSGFCPKCNTPLTYEMGDVTVECPGCDLSFEVAALNKSSNAISSSVSSALSMITGFDNPESGVVFIENFFDTYNWKDYQETEEILIKDVSEVIQRNKIRNGASGQAWYIDYKGLAVPVAKKLEGLNNIAAKIAEKYDPEDMSESFANFDIYRKVSKALVANREEILKQLECAVKYAEKFKLDADKLAEIKKDLKDLTAALNALVAIETIQEVPGYDKAQEKVDKELEKVFAAKGIDAKAVYADALSIYNSSALEKGRALELFESIRGYGESVRYIEKINVYFDFNSEMFHFFGKYYIYKKESFQMPALNVANLGKKKEKAKDPAQGEEQQSVTAYTLYEIVNGVPSKDALVKGIEQFVTCYGSKYYYFKKNQGLYCFDLLTHTDTCVDAGKTADYMGNGAFQVRLVLNGTAIAIKKKLAPIEKKGCLGFGKKKKVEEILINNFSLILVDVKSATTRVVVKEMVDICDPYDKEIFYIFAERPIKGKDKKGNNIYDEKVAPISKLMVCDLASGENKSILSDSCEIHTVSNKKVVYSLWKPNALNRDLRVYDIVNGTDTLIEDNIYKYFAVIDGNIYYTIGNSSYRPLVRNSFDGNDRKEIMQNVENIIGIRAGWLYVSKGRRYNKTLIKVSADGESRVIICSQLKKIINFSSSYVHYVDINNQLRVVRTDGKEDRIIGENITWAIIDDNYLYYVRREKVELASDTLLGEDKYAFSLYKMDKDGSNVKKLVFNVADVKGFDDKRLFYVTKGNVRFKVTVPVDKKHTETHYEEHFVTRYFEFDKATEKSTVVMTLGLPARGTSFKSGCLKKEVKADVVFEEAPVVLSFKYKGLAAIGAVEAEAEEKKQEKKAESNAAPAKKEGLLGKIKGIFKK